MTAARPEGRPIALDPKSVIIPDFRQRNKAEPDDALLSSMERVGLLQPIVVHTDRTLVAGERRLRGALQLEWGSIPALLFENLSPVQQFEAELQENLARKQLSWQEEVRAIGRYHQMRVEAYAGWTQMGTAEALGMSKGHLSNVLAVAEDIEDEEVVGCQTLKGAFNLISARAERAKIAAVSRGLLAADTVAGLLPALPSDATKEERTRALLDSLETTKIAGETLDDIDKGLKAIQDGKNAAALLAAQRRQEIASELIICADFLEWAEGYTGPKFDVVHVDFPWGKNYSGARTRKTGKAHIAPRYADDPDIYLGLVEGFLSLQDRFTFPAAHCLFWFDMRYYQWTIEQFQAAGWQLVSDYPYQWTKGYSGIASDVQRRPRHCYESALMFSRGDRKIVKLDKDWFDCPIDEKLHLNQKPLAMLKHFLGIFCDEHTAVLDPTCGSGSALAAAKQLGASRVLGVELDPNNADVAKFMLQRVLGNEPEETTNADTAN